MGWFNKKVKEFCLDNEVLKNIMGLRTTKVNLIMWLVKFTIYFLKNSMIKLKYLFVVMFLFKIDNLYADSILETLEDYPVVIGCINSNLKLHEPINSGPNGCDLGKGWSKILKPSKIIWNQLKTEYGNNYEYILNVIPIINHESQFDINARGKNKFGWDCGLGQIRDIYGGCEMNLEKQISYIRNKFEYDIQKRCVLWKGERTIRCAYNRYNGQITGYNFYSNKLMVLRKFYLNYYTPLLTPKQN